MSNTNFPEEIKKARLILGLNQTDFGKKFGYDKTVVSAWEHGRRKAPYKVLSYILNINNTHSVCPMCKGTGYVRK